MRRISILAPFSWALYDFANTIYSMNVVSFYFPLWLTVDKGLPEIAYSLVYSGAVVLASVLSPWVGALSDFWKSRMRPLIGGTLICVFFVIAIGAVASPWTALVFFLVAHVAYVLSLVFYNSMLPQLSNKKTLGKICGLGVGVGYIGTIVGLIVAAQFHGGEMGRQGVFLPTGFLFFLFALPLFVWGPRIKTEKEMPPLIEFSWKKVWNWKSHRPQMRWFLAANFLCGDAVHTVILFVSVYVKKVFGMSDDAITQFFIVSTFSAIAGSFFWGEMTSRTGALKCLRYVLILWLVVFVLGSTAADPRLYWIVGSLVGVALSGTWIPTRVLIVELAPPNRVGEYFGLYNLTGKSAAVFGPILWGFLLFVLTPLGDIKYRYTLFVLTFFILGALWALKKVEETHIGKTKKT